MSGARSEVSAVNLSEFGATPVAGDWPIRSDLGRRVCELGSINVDCCRFRYEGNYSQWIRARLLKTSPKRDTAKGLSATTLLLENSLLTLII
jgi:hypothetical protein